MEIRQAALKCLIKILEHKKPYDETLEIYAAKVENPPGLVNIVAGAIKMRIALDYFIGRISSRKAKKLSPVVKNMLRLGIFELEYLKHPDYAVVNSYVNIINQQDKKSASFVNAILRNFLRKRQEISIKNEDLSTKYSHPGWMVDRWVRIYGRETTEKILQYNNTPPSTCLRINRLKITKAEFLQLLNENKIAFKESVNCEDCIIPENSGNIRNIPGYKEGFWVVQGESSAMVVPVLNPQKYEKILDMCAAPGSKTTHIASFMENIGTIAAVDISQKRLQKITENCKRLGITIVKTITGDAAKIKLNEKYDRILVDAPCSNTGVLAKRPDARWNRKPEDIASLAELQLNILNNAASMLKVGGVLIYSTCSIEPEENQRVVEKFIDINKHFVLESVRQILQSEEGVDGFFIARITKKPV